MNVLALVLAVPLPALDEDLPAAQTDGSTAALAESADTSEPQDFWNWLGGGKYWLQLRYRYENVEDGAFGTDGHASTLRTMLGVETPRWNGFSATLEFLSVTEIGASDLHSDGSNGVPRPGVVDPETTNVNQVFLRYNTKKETDLWGGRRRIILDNARFIGDVDWRQVRQTYDSAGFDLLEVEKARVFWSYFWNANLVTARELRQDSSVLNMAYEFGPAAKASAYWYYLDFDVVDPLRASSSTIGGRIAGKPKVSDSIGIPYLAEYAFQTGIGNNPNDVDQPYLHANVGAGTKAITGRVGYEAQGGSTDTNTGATSLAFTTPLGTNFKFNGWADKFLRTPDTGLRDAYLALNGDIKAFKWAAFYHDFRADAGGGRYGSEVDFLLRYAFTPELGIEARYADFWASSDSTFEDTRKFWITLNLSI